MSWSVFKLAWGKNGTPDTLTGTADHMDITDLTATKFLVILNHELASGQTEPIFQFNNDTGSNYAYRENDNGTADSTGISQSGWFHWTPVNTTDNFGIIYVINIGSEEKLGISFNIGANTAGATNAPGRREWVYKWANTSNQITEIDCDNNGTGDFLTDSNLSALGTD